MKNTAKDCKHQILSLGGGVQSSALFLMSLHGEIPNPCQSAVFADTGWERPATYDAVGRLTEYASKHGVTVHTVKAGDIRANAVSRDFTDMPVFIKNKVGTSSMARRQCTAVYKISPTNRKVKELTACKPSAPAALWMGFSLDEATRMRRDRYKQIINRYPLIEKRLTRADCMLYLERNGFSEVSKSSCVGCPMRSNESWRQLTETELADAADVERRLQKTGIKINGETPYLHKKLVSIDTRPFDTTTDDQLSFDFEAEACAGACFT